MDLIEEIKSRLTITELLDRLGIKPNASGFIYSIYNEEKTPSLKIYEKTNSYFDFSANKGGDVIKFYADYCNTDVSTAIKELGNMLGISMAKNDANKPYGRYSETPVKKKKKENYKARLLNFEIEMFEERAGICEYDGGLNRDEAEAIAFDEVLRNRREIQTKIFMALYEFNTAQGINEQAFEYLTGDKRGLTANAINKFKLFSINSAKVNIEFLKDTFEKEELLLSGLFSRKYFVFSKHRIVIPYIENGKIVYLRGRYFYDGKSEPEKFGKYIGLNNISLTLPAKRFYNVDLLKELNPFSNVIITEGEFDAIIANQYGNNCIAIPGVTNFPTDQIELLKPFNVYLLFDNDDAGRKASKEVVREFKKHGQRIKILKLRNYKDITEMFKDEKRLA